MPTMQEYLEEMARRQALGWTPGVPSRFTAPVAASWNLPTTARTTMRKAVPKANLGDIAAASADPKPAPRRGRPRLTPEEIQRTASRQGMGTVGKTVKAIAPFAKVAGPIGLAYDVLRSEPAVASTEVPPGGYFYESQAYPSMAVEEGYPNVSTLPSFDVTPDAGGAIGGIPGVQPMEKYGPSGYEGERIPPEGFRQIAPDTVIAASDFDVGPTSMARVVNYDNVYGPAVETPSPYTGDLDRYGLGGWTPDLPEELTSGVVGPHSIFGDLWDVPEVWGGTPWGEDIPNEGFIGDIIDKANTAPKGALERMIATNAGMATVPTVTRTSLPGRTPQSQQAEFDLVDLASDVAPPGTSDADIKDVARHAALINRLPVDTDKWTDPFTFTGQVGATIHDNVYDFMADTLGGEITDDQARQDLRDIVNNEILKDVTNSTAIGIKDLSDLDKAKMGMSGANIVWDSDQLDAMVQLNKTGYYKPSELIDSIEEVVSQVDTFKDIPAAPAKPAGPTRAELKAAAAAQRKADAKARKAAARRAKIARQALKDSQAAAVQAAAASAAQASRARSRAQAVLDKARSTDRGGPSQAEINAAIEVMSQVDTFGGGSIGFDGGGFDPQGGTTGSSGMGAWT